jgi:hypothetical protein
MSKRKVSLAAVCALAVVLVGLGLPRVATGNVIIIQFHEDIPTMAGIVTGPVLPPFPYQPEQPFEVEKYIHNGTDQIWTDFHIDLEVLVPGTQIWQPSGEGDGISFDQPTPFAQWLLTVTVDINGDIVDPALWDVVRTNAPFDGLDFYFLDGFSVPHCSTLSLHFTMRDNDNNTWRLRQTPTAIPEPATLTLCALGLGALALRRRRRSA